MSKQQENAEQSTAKNLPFMYIEGTPMAIHANMQTGVFCPFGDEEKSFRKMSINLLGWRFFESKMFVKESKSEETLKEILEKGLSLEEAKAQTEKKLTNAWAELYFVKDFDKGQKNPICSMLIKTYSLQNFVNEAKKFFYEIMPDGEPCKMSDLTFELSTNKKTKGDKSFYEILFKGKMAEKEVVNQITEFLATEPRIYDAGNLQENIRNGHTYRLLPNTQTWQVPENFGESRKLLLGLPKEETEVEVDVA